MRLLESGDVEINAIAIRIRCRDSEGKEVRFGFKFNIVKDSEYLYIHRLGLEKAIEYLKKCSGIGVEVEQLWG